MLCIRRRTTESAFHQHPGKSPAEDLSKIGEVLFVPSCYARESEQRSSCEAEERRNAASALSQIQEHEIQRRDLEYGQHSCSKLWLSRRLPCFARRANEKREPCAD